MSIAESSQLDLLHMQTCRLQAFPQYRGGDAALVIEAAGVLHAVAVLEDEGI
jgi:hypothetical protein